MERSEFDSQDLSSLHLVITVLSEGASLGRVGVGELVLPRRGKRDRREAGSGFEPRINGIESDPTIRAFCNKWTAERTAFSSLRLDRCTVLMTVLARIWEGAFSNAVVGLAVR